MTNIQNTHRFHPKYDDEFLFDTNIWLAVYGPFPSNHWTTKEYSSFLKKLMSSECKIYTNTMIISEFINVWARLEFHQRRINLGLSPKEFKIFRGMPDFQNIAYEIAQNVRKILNIAELLDDGICKLNVASIIKEFEKGDSDFNDIVFKEFCQNNKLIFVTNDADFNYNSINIVTANNKLSST